MWKSSDLSCKFRSTILCLICLLELFSWKVVAANYDNSNKHFISKRQNGYSNIQSNFPSYERSPNNFNGPSYGQNSGPFFQRQQRIQEWFPPPAPLYPFYGRLATPIPTPPYTIPIPYFVNKNLGYYKNRNKPAALYPPFEDLPSFEGNRYIGTGPTYPSSKEDIEGYGNILNIQKPQPNQFRKKFKHQNLAPNGYLPGQSEFQPETIGGYYSSNRK